MSSRGGRQDTAREAHVEDVARVFSSAYAGKNTVGFCTFDRDANAFSLAQAIVRDDDEDVLKLFFRTSGADVVYCSSEFKAAIEKMSDARATTIWKCHEGSLETQSTPWKSYATLGSLRVAEIWLR